MSIPLLSRNILKNSCSTICDYPFFGLCPQTVQLNNLVNGSLSYHSADDTAQTVGTFLEQRNAYSAVY